MKSFGALLLMSIASALASGCAFIGGVFGVRSFYEAPAYTVQRTLDPFQIRDYPPRLAAEVTVPNSSNADGQAFGLLFDYINGNNAGQRKIDMTVPVESRPTGQNINMTVPVQSDRNSDTVTLRFFLPSKLRQTGAPQPSNPAVQIIDLPSETIAVRTLRGSVNNRRLQRAKTDLLRDTTSHGYQPIGNPVIYYYDPPFTLPWFRKTEAAVPIKPS